MSTIHLLILMKIEYNTFTNIDENAKGNVKFIMMIDSLKREENKKDQAILQTEIKEKEE